MNKNLISRVIIVDDDPTIFDLLYPRLAREGFLVCWKKSPEEAIQYVTEKRVDCLITDIVMPKINGFELIKILKDNPKSAKIEYIILSNYGENRIVYDFQFLQSLGIRRYLIKSNYTPIELAKEIKKTLKSAK